MARYGPGETNHNVRGGASDPRWAAKPRGFLVAAPGCHFLDLARHAVSLFGVDILSAQFWLSRLGYGIIEALFDMPFEPSSGCDLHLISCVTHRVHVVAPRPRDDLVNRVPERAGVLKRDSGRGVVLLGSLEVVVIRP